MSIRLSQEEFTDLLRELYNIGYRDARGESDTSEDVEILGYRLRNLGMGGLRDILEDN